MRKWQQGLDRYAKVKFSEINTMDKGVKQEARIALANLLTNGFGAIDGYAINEVMNMIKSLKELKVEYSMRVIQNYGQNYTVETGKYPTFHYEFSLPWFVDDRDEPGITSGTISGTAITTTRISGGTQTI